MKKAFFNIYIFFTAVCIIGCILSFTNFYLKASIVYMFLAISAGCITVMLKPRQDKKRQEEIEIKALVVLLLTVISAAVLVITQTPSS